MTRAHRSLGAMEQFAKTSFESLAFCPSAITPDVRMGTGTMTEVGSLDTAQHQEEMSSEPQDRYHRGRQNALQCPPLLTANHLPSIGVTKHSPEPEIALQIIAPRAPSAQLPWMVSRVGLDDLKGLLQP